MVWYKKFREILLENSMEYEVNIAESCILFIARPHVWFEIKLFLEFSLPFTTFTFEFLEHLF